jgi:hypothetical protein
LRKQNNRTTLAEFGLDVVAGEIRPVAHALLDALSPNRMWFRETTNPDVRELRKGRERHGRDAPPLDEDDVSAEANRPEAPLSRARHHGRGRLGMIPRALRPDLSRRSSRAIEWRGSTQSRRLAR